MPARQYFSVDFNLCAIRAAAFTLSIFKTRNLSSARVLPGWLSPCRSQEYQAVLGQRVEAASERLGAVAARLGRGMEAEAEGVGKAFAGGFTLTAGNGLKGLGCALRRPPRLF